MMEESHSCKRHYHAILIAGFDYDVVADRAAGLGDVGNAALLRALDAVGEGEECVGAEGYAGDRVEICVPRLSRVLTAS